MNAYFLVKWHFHQYTHMCLNAPIQETLILPTGVCECNKGYGGGDCFVATDQPPNLFLLANNGLCDSSRDVCDTVTIYNNNTINITTLACYFMPAMVIDNKDMPQTCLNYKCITLKMV